MHNFAFHHPTSVADAAKAIGAASDGKIIAGGQTLLPTLAPAPGAALGHGRSHRASPT